MTETGYDAATPPANPPHDDVVIGYLGGDTPHVWTPEDWNSQPARYRLGMWVRSNPEHFGGTGEAYMACRTWRSLGAPLGTLIGLDLEEAINAAYVSAFETEVKLQGLQLVLYGSKSTLFQNPKPAGGYFVPDLTGVSHLYPGSTMTQYEFGSAWDSDTIKTGLPLWDTRPPAPTPAPTGDTMPYLIAVEPGTGIYLVDAGTVVHVLDPDQATRFEARFGAPIVVDPAQYQEMITRTVTSAATPSHVNVAQ